MMPVLLFLCGGRRVGLLREFRRALHEHGGGRILTTDTEPRAATTFVADRTFDVAPCRDTKRFAADVVAVCAKEGVTAVLPLTCAAVAGLSALRGCTNSRIICGDDEAIRICTDKLATAIHFRRVGLFTPEVVSCPTGGDLPLFCRPRWSEGSIGATQIITERELENAPRDDAHIYTHYLCGTEYTVDCYKDLRGDLIAVTPRQRLRVRAGEVERSVTRHLGTLIEQARTALEPLNFVGPATVQVLVVDGRAHFTEVNLRYGGGVTLSIAAGANSPWWLVAELCGLPLPPRRPVRWNLAMSRYDEEFYYQED